MIQKEKLPYGCETIDKNFSYVWRLLVCAHVCEIEYTFAYFAW